jgi:hypothetical protein
LVEGQRDGPVLFAGLIDDSGLERVDVDDPDAYEHVEYRW